jgi:hypothetical protein
VGKVKCRRHFNIVLNLPQRIPVNGGNITENEFVIPDLFDIESFAAPKALIENENILTEILGIESFAQAQPISENESILAEAFELDSSMQTPPIAENENILAEAFMLDSTIQTVPITENENISAEDFTITKKGISINANFSPSSFIITHIKTGTKPNPAVLGGGEAEGIATTLSTTQYSVKYRSCGTRNTKS